MGSHEWNEADEVSPPQEKHQGGQHIVHQADITIGGPEDDEEHDNMNDRPYDRGDPPAGPWYDASTWVSGADTPIVSSRPSVTSQAPDIHRPREAPEVPGRPTDPIEEFRQALVSAAAGHISAELFEHIGGAWNPDTSGEVGRVADQLTEIQDTFSAAVVENAVAAIDVRGPTAAFLSVALDITFDAALAMLLPGLGGIIRTLRIIDVAGAFLSGERVATGRGLQQVAECRSAKALAADLAGEQLGDILNETLDRHGAEFAERVQAQQAVQAAVDLLRQQAERRRRATALEGHIQQPSLPAVDAFGPPVDHDEDRKATAAGPRAGTTTDAGDNLTRRPARRTGPQLPPSLRLARTDPDEIDSGMESGVDEVEPLDTHTTDPFVTPPRSAEPGAAGGPRHHPWAGERGVIDPPSLQ
jgi:hypothetical protein